MAYVIVIIVGCVVVGLLFKPTVGFIVGLISYKRDPIRLGQIYIKDSLRKGSSINEELIPDEVFRRFAERAYAIAESTHTLQRDALVNVFNSYLDNYVDQIHNVMSGHGGELEEDVAKILREYGVKIPPIARLSK